MTDLALATRSAGFEQRVRRAFGGTLNGELRRWRGVVTEGDLRAIAIDLTQGDPGVVTLGPDIPLDLALDLAREIDDARPEISVVVVTEPAPDMWEDALRAGVRDVVPSSAPDEELRQALERAMHTSNRRRRNLVKGGDGDAGAAGRVITVVAPKGGSGKTAIATNLGVGLARAAPGKVALVDLDLQFGDVAQVLALKPDHTIADAATSKLDTTALKVFLTKRPDGLFVLCAPGAPDEGEQVTEGLVHRAVGLLADEFPYVVVDTSAGLTEQTLAVLELSTDLVLVCDLSASSARSMEKVVAALDRLGMTGATRHLVINRADSKVGLDLTEMAAAVGKPIDFKLPSSRAVAYSMNEGMPLVDSAPRSAFARRITDMVATFVPEAAPSRRRLFAGRFTG